MEPRTVSLRTGGKRLGDLVVMGAVVLAHARVVSAASSFSSSRYGTMSTWFAECDAEHEACLADDVCRECVLAPPFDGPCAVLYPSIFHSGSAGEGPGYSFCEATGAEYCCDFADRESAEECMTNPVTAAFWDCTMIEEGCSVDDMPCYSGVLVTLESTTSTTDDGAAGTLPPGAADDSFSEAAGDFTTSAPSSTPSTTDGSRAPVGVVTTPAPISSVASSVEDGGSDVTPSPAAGVVDDGSTSAPSTAGADTTTTSAAARMLASSGVVLAGLLVAAAAVLV